MQYSNTTAAVASVHLFNSSQTSVNTVEPLTKRRNRLNANKRGVAGVTIQSAGFSGAEGNSGGDDEQKAPGEGV